MKRSNLTGALALVCLLAATPAPGQDAREIKKSALRGVETFIAVHSNYTQLTAELACEEGAPVKIDVVTPPKHGTLAMHPVVGPRTVTVEVENP